jgi:putative nucleotidyltransferase with HDIG domain
LNLEHTKTREAFLGIISSLAKALEARDPYTEGHSQRVTNYALIMADKLGWGDELKEKLNSAALLHDLGKIGIPDSILHKKGALTDEEYDFIKKHEVISIKILEPLKEIKEVLPWILYHHERWDGTGYPHGLGGNSIPLGAQIIALADTFDAITTGRDYKKSLSVEEALNEIIKFKGVQFNPQLVDVFVEAIRINHPQK